MRCSFYKSSGTRKPQILLFQRLADLPASPEILEKSPLKTTAAVAEAQKSSGNI